MPLKVNLKDLSREILWNEDGSRKRDLISVVPTENPNADIGDDNHIVIWQMASGKRIDNEQTPTIHHVIVVADNPEVARERVLELDYDRYAFFDDHHEHYPDGYSPRESVSLSE